MGVKLKGQNGDIDGDGYKGRSMGELRMYPLPISPSKVLPSTLLALFNRYRLILRPKREKERERERI